MHTGLEERGDWARVAEYYAERARGGVGLIVTGGHGRRMPKAVFSPVRRGCIRRRISPTTGWSQTAFMPKAAKIAMQILHAGRYAYSPDCVAPSALKSPISPFKPRALDEDGIEKQIADIATAAARAQQAGYDGIEVMGSEGYFLNQFLCAATNHRTDPLGGCL